MDAVFVLKLLKNKRMKLLLAVAMILAAIYWLGSNIMMRFMAGPGMFGQMPPAQVDVIQVEKQAWVTTTSATGTLKAMRGVDIFAEVPGRVTAIRYEPASYVEKGTSLIQLDDDILKAELKQAQAQAWLSETDYRRAQELYRRQVGSQQERDQALAKRNVERAEVARLQAELDKRTIKAPFAGYVGLANIELGQYVDSNTVLTNIQTIQPLRVDFKVSEVFLSRLKLALPVRLHLSAYPDETFQGEVYAIDTQVDVKTRSVALRAKVENPSHRLKPGLFAEITLDLAGKQEVIVIPQTALVYDESGSFVYVVEDGAAKKVNLELGQRRGDQVVVLSGLKPDQIIVVSGQIKLQDGAPVQVNQE